MDWAQVFARVFSFFHEVRASRFWTKEDSVFFLENLALFTAFELKNSAEDYFESHMGSVLCPEHRLIYVLISATTVGGHEGTCLSPRQGLPWGQSTGICESLAEQQSNR